MKKYLYLLFIAACWQTIAQTNVEEKIVISDEEKLELGFDFANEIELINWEKNEVVIKVSVTINDGEDDEIFELITRKHDGVVSVNLNLDNWKNQWSQNDCYHTSEINYTVYFPSSMKLEAKSISGNFTLKTLNGQAVVKTISGDIDLTVPDGLDFNAKTITGEIYSDLEIEYPFGREGLNQIVGMKVKGKVKNGSAYQNLETISGNIYLRKG